jgi:cytochrome c-type biogenesis protein
MKIATFCCLFILFAGCQQSTQPDQIFSNAEYSGNVSSVYRVGALGDGANETDFSWRDSTGFIHSLSEYKGRTVLLNFWATWCGYCAAEMPALENIAANSPDFVVVIGVSTDNDGNTFQTVRDFTATNKIGFQIVVDSMMNLFSDYIAAANGYSIPETFVIGKDGTIKFLLEGEQSEQAFESYIAKAN